MFTILGRFFAGLGIGLATLFVPHQAPAVTVEASISASTTPVEATSTPVIKKPVKNITSIVQQVIAPKVIPIVPATPVAPVVPPPEPIIVVPPTVPSPDEDPTALRLSNEKANCTDELNDINQQILNVKADYYKQYDALQVGSGVAENFIVGREAQLLTTSNEAIQKLQNQYDQTNLNCQIEEGKIQSGQE